MKTTSEEELGKLSVQILNCQTLAERKPGGTRNYQKCDV